MVLQMEKCEHPQRSTKMNACFVFYTLKNIVKCLFLMPNIICYVFDKTVVSLSKSETRKQAHRQSKSQVHYLYQRYFGDYTQSYYQSQL